MFSRRPLHEITVDLAAVAGGRRAADVVIQNGAWVNVFSGEFVPQTTIAVWGSRIAYCGPHVPDLIGSETEVIDAAGRYLVPGLLDAHVHIESSMLSVRGYAAAVLPHGTTGVFADPHEIANVLGLEGVRLMADEARATPLQVYVQIPSCVPAAPGLETSGATIGLPEVEEALSWPSIIGLGEVMNYPGVAAGDPLLHAEIAETLKRGRTVGGHYASKDLGLPFHAYAAAGPSDCHEGTRIDDTLARIRQGMYAMLRQGSSEHNVAAQVRAITEMGLESRRMLLCTDDRHPDTLVHAGHMDDVVRLAIREGVSPMVAIQMATLNTAEHFGVSSDVGCIGPGRYADILIVSDLEAFVVDEVIAAGQRCCREGKLLVDMGDFSYPSSALHSMHVPRLLTARDFDVSAPDNQDIARCWVIGAVENQVLTTRSVADIRCTYGMIDPSLESGVSRLAVIDRHTESMRMSHGLVRGYGFDQPYALASSVAHDCHNLLVMGSDKELMAQAANRVVELSGGISLVGSSGPVAELALPVAGLVSEEPLEVVASNAQRLHEGLMAMGCAIQDALMSFVFLALPVIPSLRLTDLGLVDVNTFKIVSLFADTDNAED